MLAVVFPAFLFYDNRPSGQSSLGPCFRNRQIAGNVLKLLVPEAPRCLPRPFHPLTGSVASDLLPEPVVRHYALSPCGQCYHG